jgi:adhesin/invasin
VVTVGITDTLSNAGRVVVTVKNGSHEVNIPIYFGADIQLNPATSNSIADGTVVAPLTATVIDASRAVVVGVPVHFSVTAGEAILNVSEVLTDTFGKATVQVTDSIIENAVVHATAGDLAGDSATISFLAGAPANLLLTSAPVNTTPLSLFGAATVTATVTDALGNNVEDNTPVQFVVSGTASNAIVTAEATTTGGVATAALSAGSTSGSLTMTATAGTINETISFTVASRDAGSVGVESVDPGFVQMLGMRGVQTSTITFMVLDAGDNKVADGTDVVFTLDPLQLGGGERIFDGLNSYGITATTQTVAGQATVLFRSGVVSGTVDITATVSTPLSTDISSIAQVTVVSGMPDSLHLPVSGSPLNVPALTFAGLTSDFNITVGDRYGNPVPDGTNVSFMVEPGCGLIGSSTGFMTTTTKGKITELFDHAVDNLFPNAPLSAGPKCTVVAYMPGDEGFADENGNGVWDAGEPCPGNNGEPYVDANDSGSRDPGELFIDVDGLGSYTPANLICDTDTQIWTEFSFLQSGDMSTFTVAPATFTLGLGVSETFTVTVADANGAPPIAGTKLSVTTTAGILLNGGDSTFADTNEVEAWEKSFTLLSSTKVGGELVPATITVLLTFPEVQGGRTIPDQIVEIAGDVFIAP